MRWTGWIFVLAVTGLAGTAVGYQPGCAECNGGMAGGAWGQALDAEPCCGRPGYCLVPGCCEDTRHCCDNAWAGYCEHRTRGEAFLTRVGGPCCGSRPCYRGPMTPGYAAYPCDPATMQPTPAIRPLPVPPLEPIPPDKVTRLPDVSLVR
jgi:hypothetical protein